MQASEWVKVWVLYDTSHWAPGPIIVYERFPIGCVIDYEFTSLKTDMMPPECIGLVRMR